MAERGGVGPSLPPCPYWLRSPAGNRCLTMRSCPVGYACDVSHLRRKDVQTRLF